MSSTQPTDPLPRREEHVAPTAVAEPFYRRHGLAFAIATLVLSIVVFLGIVTAGAFAVSSIVTHVGQLAISRVVPDPGSGVGGDRAPGQRGGRGGRGQQGAMPEQGRILLRGSIARISGSTWTIDRQNGASVDVLIDSSTVFGAPGRPAARGDFAKGDEVVVMGTRSGAGVTAKSILKLPAFPTPLPSTPGTGATPGP